MRPLLETLMISGLTVELIRKRIRGLRLAVYPPEGRVRVTAPFFVTPSQIASLVEERLPWIKKHQEKFQKVKPKVALSFESGETHFFLGHPYLLEVIEGFRIPKVTFDASRMIFTAREGWSKEDRQLFLQKWYKRQLEVIVPALIEKWSFALGVKANDWSVRQMKTRWGTCNTTSKKIWLSVELARYPVECIEYVVVHELVHLLEASHNDRFKRIMTEALPQWKTLQKTLKNGLKADSI